MRTLDPFLIINNALYIVSILSVCLLNIYVLVRLRRDFLTRCVHVVSFFLLTGLFCSMMDVVIIELPIEVIYRQIGQISYILSLICFLIGLIVYLIQIKNHNSCYGLPQDLEAVYKSAADLIIVADYRGIITQVNDIEKLNRHCQTSKSVIEVMECFKGKYQGNWPEKSKLDEGFQVEFLSEITDDYFLLKVFPISSTNVIIGYTMIIEDISEIRRSEMRLKETNDDLLKANDKLAHSVVIAGALEAEKERLDILEQIQTSLIEKIEHSVSKVRQIQAYSFSKDKYQEDIKELSELLRSVYKDVRDSISKISGRER